MIPGPIISAIVSEVPLFNLIQGRPFREGPKGLAAVPPRPFSPLGFSAVIAPDFPSYTTDIKPLHIGFVQILYLFPPPQRFREPADECFESFQIENVRRHLRLYRRQT